MRLFSHAPSDAAAVAALADHLGRTPRAVRREWLADATGPGLWVVALRDVLAVRGSVHPTPASAASRDDGAAGEAVVGEVVGPSSEDAPDGASTPGGADRWTSWPWQVVQDGGWTGENSRLQLRLLDGERYRFVLDDPGRLPSVFAERVQSSILVEERVRVPDGEVLVSGRRPPVSASVPGRPQVMWHALALGRADLSDPRTERIVLAATERLRLDYDM